MTTAQINEVNKTILKYKPKTGAFVGDEYDWDNFIKENEKKIKWKTQRRFELENGDLWRWIYIEKNQEQFRGTAFGSIILPKRLDYELFCDWIYPYLNYCTEIKWYGAAEDEIFYEENK